MLFRSPGGTSGISGNVFANFPNNIVRTITDTTIQSVQFLRATGSYPTTNTFTIQPIFEVSGSLVMTGSRALTTLRVTGSARFTGRVTAQQFVETSTREKKYNIIPISASSHLNKLIKLTPIYFNYKDDLTYDRHIGLIAEDLMEVYPEFVEFDEYNKIEGINYSKMVSVLIQCIKELNDKVELQQNQIDIINKKLGL